MKKILGILALVVMGITGFSSASTLQIDRLYELIDQIVEKKPLMKKILVDRLEGAKQRSTKQESRDLLSDLIRYIREGKGYGEGIEREGIEKKSMIPAGFGRISDSDIERMKSIFWFEGDSSAPIWVIEFIDMQCPYCKKQHTNKVLETLREIEYPGKVRTAAAMFPLTGKRHELAQNAAEAIQCTGILGGTESYTAMKSSLYSSGLQPTKTKIAESSRSIGLNSIAVQSCIDSGKAKEGVREQKETGRKLGARGTPATAVIDSRSGAFKMIGGAVPAERFFKDIETLWNSEE